MPVERIRTVPPLGLAGGPAGMADLLQTSDAPTGSAATVQFQGLWQDTFQNSISPIWNHINTSGTLTPNPGYAQFGGNIGAWTNGQALWSPQYIQSVEGAVTFTVRVRGTTGRFGVFLENSQNPATPSHGVVYSSTSGYPQFFADTAQAIGIGNSYGGIVNNLYVASIDYTFALIPRPSGGLWVLVSGGDYGTWPVCTVILVDFASPSLTSYANMSAGLVFNGNAANAAENVYYAEGLTASQAVAAGITDQWALAIAADDFSGGGAISGRALKKGGIAWSANSNATLTGGVVVLDTTQTFQGISCVPSARAGWFVYDVSLAANDGTSQVSFDILGDSGFNNCIRVGLNIDYNVGGTNQNIGIGRYAAGVLADNTNTAIGAYSASTTYRLAIHFSGSIVSVYWRGALVTNYSTTQGASNTRVQITNWGSTANVSIVRVELWQPTFTLPSNWRSSANVRPVVGGSLPAAWYTDAFSSDTINGGGAQWTIQSGTLLGVALSTAWTVSGGFAQPTNDQSNAVVTKDTGDVNHGVSIQTKHTYSVKNITAISVANPTHVTVANHGIAPGATVSIAGTNSTPAIDGSTVATVIDANTFSVPVNVTGSGNTGTVQETSGPVTDANDWGNVIILRWVDINNLIFCRLLWQSGSCELELWQIVNGTSISQIFVPLGQTGGLTEGSTYTFEGYVSGPDISIWLTYPSGSRRPMIQDTVQSAALLVGGTAGFGSIFNGVVGNQLFTNANLYQL